MGLFPKSVHFGFFRIKVVFANLRTIPPEGERLAGGMTVNEEETVAAARVRTRFGCATAGEAAGFTVSALVVAGRTEIGVVVAV